MQPIPSYADLTIKIEAGPKNDTLTIRFLESPFGPTQPVRFRWPYPAHEVPEVLATLEQKVLGSADSSLDLPRGLTLQALDENTATSIDPATVGTALFDSLFLGSHREILLSSLALMQSREAMGLRIRLVFDPELAAELNRWPWELLYRHETRDFLGRSIVTPVVRQLEVRRSSLAPRPFTRLRVLLVLSNPTGVAPLNVQGEHDLIQHELQAVPDVEIHALNKPTIKKLRRLVRSEAFDVLHFVGHGDLSAEGQGRILLETSEGTPHPIPGAILADTLKSFSRPGVVFLNACETARMPRNKEGSDPFSGVASALVMGGIPAVVAMQFPITDRAALHFSSEFYSSLSAGHPLEAAVADGRMAMLDHQPHTWEWATPVLFLGIPTGQLFQRKQDGTSSESNLTSEIAGALELFENQRYEPALKNFLTLRATFPSSAEIAYLTALARLQGRRPRTFHLGTIRQVEADLAVASDLAGREIPAHFWYLQALVKHDFYRLKGMRIKPPSVTEILAEARIAPAVRSELQRLEDHVPIPPSAIAEVIAQHRRSVADQ